MSIFSRPLHIVVPAALSLMAVFSGCDTLGTGGGDRFETTLQDTSKRVRKLENDMGGSLRELNSATAELVARVDSSDAQIRRLRTLAEENQVKLDDLSAHLESLKDILFRNLQITPAPSVSVTPGAAAALPAPEVGQPAVLTPAPAEIPEPAEAPRADYGDPRLHYQNAHALSKDQDYDAAIREFDLFLERYPNDPLAANAQFWKAKCLVDQGKDAAAIEELQRVYISYPTSSKAPQAMNMEAKAALRLNQAARARALWQKVIDDYPISMAADEAKAALANM